jgi:hypothetical protein
VLWGPDERDWEQNLVANANDAQIRAMSRSANIVRPVANFSDEGTAHFHERALFRRRASSPRASPLRYKSITRNRRRAVRA